MGSVKRIGHCGADAVQELSHPFPSVLLVTPPAVQPISRTEAKLHLRVDHTTEDDLVDWLLAAALAHVENYTSRRLITQTWKAFFHCFDEEILLPFGSLQSVTHLKYTDITDTQATFSSTNYEVDIYREPGLIRLAYSKTWPSVTLKYTNPIEVQFVCGYGDDGADVPMPIRQAMYLIIGHLYKNREAVVVGSNFSLEPFNLPLGVSALLDPYRLYYV